MYVNSSELAVKLEARAEEQREAEASIERLISVLDQKKDEAIERTFKQVSKAFVKVFGELSNGGRCVVWGRGGETDSILTQT